MRLAEQAGALKVITAVRARLLPFLPFRLPLMATSRAFVPSRARCQLRRGEPATPVAGASSRRGGARPTTTFRSSRTPCPGAAADTIGQSFTREKANGVFVIVELDLTNEENQPATIFEDAIRLISGGNSFSTSDDALFALGDKQSFLLEEIQPGVTESGTLVYDIPPDAASGAVLQAEDLFSGDTGEIELGL
jgi:uncharacterized protein DUF4352